MTALIDRTDVPEPIENVPGVTFRDLLMSGSHRSERVIYYRRPRTDVNGEPIEEQRWIRWGDTSTGKYEVMLYLGYEPLRQYGYLKARDNEQQPLTQFDIYGVWGPILTHPEGPLEFPVEQITAYKWYRPELLPRSQVEGYPHLTHIRFPQLGGQKITEYPCPECGRRYFLEAVHLARHLRNSHDYERHEVIAYGTSIGVDFAKTSEFGSGVRTIEYDAGPTVAPEPVAPAFELEQVTPDSAVAELAPRMSADEVEARAQQLMIEKTRANKERMAKVRAGRSKR